MERNYQREKGSQMYGMALYVLDLPYAAFLILHDSTVDLWLDGHFSPIESTE